MPPTYPIVIAFEAMQAFLAAEQVDLVRIVHGEQRFAYERPIRVGDRLSATLSVASVRQIGGADIIGTRSAIHDASGALVCMAKATLVHTGGPA
ncbi:FAS1-like dehydratase domain-containing protein [Nocardioides piscis]|uniref:MaoC family dehydratase n=1 Tax=Nocardioides piscis TaxID=2714938 RepID=A0A6G7YCF9_9ACTN|nr:MaoC family dehydratase N-terminal domain-containing protein [Nocardioides piscis]QIK74450.1 MaoC family dehydratase [Nocardioides piscis]